MRAYGPPSIRRAEGVIIRSAGDFFQICVRASVASKDASNQGQIVEDTAALADVK